MEKSKLKVAVCLAGQYRTFNNIVVQNSLQHFLFDKYDCDTYISTWDDAGKSINSISEADVVEKSQVTVEDILLHIPNAVVEIESYKEWYNLLPKNLTTLIGLATQHSGCIPQLYKKYKAFAQIPKEKHYDFVIMTRPDIFLFNEFYLEKIKNTGVIWNCNPKDTWAYFPNRIFDILYLGGKSEVEKLSQCYLHVEKLLDDPFQSGLHPLDCCKMLYNYAKTFCKLEVESTETLLGNVYRDSNSVEYNCTNSGVDFITLKSKLNL